jgi:phage terminase large subunit
VRVSEFYQPFPRQQQFHDSPAKYRLFGGAAGPGKTRALLMEAVLQANAFPGVETLLLRRTFPELEDSLLKEFRQLPRDAYREFNESKHRVTWHNGSTTRFGYCKNEKDVYQYQGAEFVFIGIDELTMFTLRQWQFLTSRNRCAVRGTFPCMAGATNPGNIGHAWVKALWVDRRPAPGMEHPEEFDAREYDFVPARVADNPIYANDRDYLAKLRAMPTRLRRAFLDGDWDIFAGQYFDIWDQSKMVRRLEADEFKDWWPRWISIDWGFKHPSAVYWHALNDEAITQTYREFVRSQLDASALGREIVARTAKGPGRERIAHVYLSPDAFAERTAARTIAEELGDALAAGGLPRPTPADDDRVGGWRLMYQLLRSGSWEIGDNCAALVRTLPLLTYDEKDGEDCAKIDDPLSDSGAVIDAETASGDDPPDSARYGMKSWHSPGRKPLQVRIAEGLESRIGKKLKDVQPEEYTHVMIQQSIVTEQERKADRPLRISRRRR